MAYTAAGRCPVYRKVCASRQVRALHAVTTNRVRWEDKRDSHRSKVYALDAKAFRTDANNGDFTDRKAAKGFARLCAKVALRHLAFKHGLSEGQVADIRASFCAAITTENADRSDASVGGIYMAAWGWDQATIAHEVAHWVDQWDAVLQRPEGTTLAATEGHGAQWRGWYSFLLAECCGFRIRYVAEAWAGARLAVVMP